MKRWLFTVGALLLPLSQGILHAGHQAPSHLDGCQSADGRFVVTAELVAPEAPKKPLAWKITWKDRKEGKSHSFTPTDITAGQLYGHMFLAPDGETIAYFNPIIQHTDKDWSPKIIGEKGTRDYATQEAFRNRLVIWKKDGTPVKALSVSDFLSDAECAEISTIFHRVHWLRDYPGLSYRSTPRSGYAWYRISPDFTVLEFRPISVRAKAKKAERVVRVSLVDGSIFPANAEWNDKNKIPVRPFLGPDRVQDTAGEKHLKDRYVPSLDPVRSEGTFKLRTAMN
jgi:hypothetical protein